MNTQNVTQDSPEEHWKTAQFIKSDGAVETYSNYMVSDRGRVGSLVNHCGNKRPVMKILKPNPSNMLGHLQVCLYVNGKRCKRSVHRLVLSSFQPEMWSKETNEVDHIDRDPTHNYLVNLHWVDHNTNLSNKVWNALKPIRVTHLNDGYVETFDSMWDCSRAFGKSLNWCDRLMRSRNGFHAKLNILIEKI